MLRSSLCDYSDEYVLAKRTICSQIRQPQVQNQKIETKKNIETFENCVQFTDCISEINNTGISC